MTSLKPFKQENKQSKLHKNITLATEIVDTTQVSIEHPGLLQGNALFWFLFFATCGGFFMTIQ